MRALVQRVSRAEVRIDGEVVGQVGRGLCVLVGTMEGDEEQDLDWMCRKLVGLRIFPDEGGKMNRSVKDIEGSVLLVSQFTLAADVRKGTRPSFTSAMKPDQAAPMIEEVAARLAADIPVETGRFGADMKVELVNDGPVTIWLDSRQRGEG